MLVVGLVLIGSAFPLARVSGETEPGRWSGRTTGSVGVEQYSEGEFIYTDFAFDDQGAATAPPVDDYENSVYPGDTAARSSRGSYHYPDDPDYGHNGADIVEIRARLDGSDVELMARLNALQRTGATAVSFALDTDGSATTGEGIWPHAARARTTGADVVVTAWGTGGSLATGAEVVEIQEPGGAVRSDLSSNTIVARVPIDALGSEGATWRIWAGAGLWDAEADEYLAVPTGETGTVVGAGSEPGYPRLFDVAFNRPEPSEGFQAYWNEVLQAETLATGDLTELSAELDLDTMRSTEDVHPGPSRGAFNWYTYRSSIDLGEGLAPEPRRSHDNFVYLSRYQPYAVYVPEVLEEPAPVLWLMHFRGGNHNGFTVGSQAYTRIADELGALIVQPHSRGEFRMCEADAEQDFFDVRREVHRNFDVDPQREFLAGMSMGGFCTWRLGLLYPDLFAAAMVYAGWPQSEWPTYGTVVDDAVPPPEYDLTHFAENARNLPFLVLHGTNDEILPINDSLRLLERLDELGYEHRVQLYPGERHNSQFPAETPSSAIAWLEGRRRTIPVHVTYKTQPELLGHVDPALRNGDHGFGYDSAYWLDGIELDDPSGPGVVDAVTEGLGRGEIETQAVEGSESDENGPYTFWGREPSGPVSVDPERNRFEVTLENVAQVGFDLTRMGIDTSRSVEFTVEGAGSVELRLRGPWGEVAEVVRDGQPFSQFELAGEILTISTDLSRRTFEVVPEASGGGTSADAAQASGGSSSGSTESRVSSQAASSQAPPGRLPITGGGVLFLTFSVALVVGGFVLRRWSDRDGGGGRVRTRSVRWEGSG